MADPITRLYLVSPLITEPDGFAPKLAEACAGGAVAAVLLRLAPADERTLVNHVKALAAAAQEKGAALIIASETDVDLSVVAARAGADGVHTSRGVGAAQALRERLKGERILGAGNVRSRHEAMELGEAGVDYVMFGEPRPDGSLPSLDAVVEQAAWWAEIFETPCVAYAPSLAAVAALARTRAEFIALGDAVWDHGEGPAAGVAAALHRCATGAAA